MIHDIFGLRADYENVVAPFVEHGYHVLVPDMFYDVEPIDTDARVRLRLGCAHGVNVAIEIADWVYKASGVSAIFLGTPFERRFRDMHTLSQQIQARDAHFENVGRIMLNGDPDGTFM